MTIEIGKKIRELRTKKLVTQEQLAVFLGVTPQAVSRWESLSSYPDIELLPAIADYFSVTIDELLGVKKTERALRLANLQNKLLHMRDESTPEENIAFARRIVTQFPSEESFHLYLADSLQRLIWSENPDKTLIEESEKIYLTILETTREIDIKCQAIVGLATHYSAWQKDDARALRMADRLPPLEYCREFTKALCIQTGRKTYLQQAIEQCTDYLTLYIKELVFETEPTDGTSALEQSVLMLKTANEITHMIFGGDMMYHHAKAAYYAKHLSTIQLALGKNDDALDSLAEMAKHAVAGDASRQNDHGRHFTSPFVDTLTYAEAADGTPDPEAQDLCRHCLTLLEDDCYDCLRDNERFRAIVKVLENRDS
ncbi:MAG: helix-turn-helix domain-containing protein [bacterium]|nr:helix-turn-helix domain-containing protein [bacterium]